MAGPRKEERHQVLAANQEFYRAFEALDPARMRAVWLEETYVSCTHPGWGRILGFGAVMTSWDDIFSSFGMSIRVSDEITHIHGDLAWVTCSEELETRLPDGVSRGRVEATNIFERHDGKWLLVHHHGSPLVRSHTPDDDLQLH
jgi:ketosteroid isomerase-like protein